MTDFIGDDGELIESPTLEDLRTALEHTTDPMERQAILCAIAEVLALATDIADLDQDEAFLDLVSLYHLKRTDFDNVAMKLARMYLKTNKVEQAFDRKSAN